MNAIAARAVSSEINENMKYIIQYFSQISSLNKRKYVHIFIVQCVSVAPLPAYN